MDKSKEQMNLYSTESEMALLGAILYNPNEIDNVISIVRSEDFYHKKHKIIYQEFVDFSSRKDSLDYVQISTSLESKGLLEIVGGSFYISGLINECPTSSQAPVYAKKVNSLAKSRNMRRLASKLVDNPDDKSLTSEFAIMSSEKEAHQNFSESDAGNAELLVYHFGDKIRYNHSEKKWFIWNGHYWEQDVSKIVFEYAKKTAYLRQHDALNITDSTKKGQSVKFALRSENHHKIYACLNSARSHQSLSTTANDWNVNPFLLQCKNGGLVLNNEIEFTESSPEFMTSLSIGCEYNPEAECPTFDKAISEMMDNSQQLVEFMQRAIGYSLSGDISEHCFFIMYGSGANGKTVLQNTIKSLLGDYAKHTQFTSFTRKYNDSSTNEIARLHSARIVIASEGSDSKKFDEERLKQVTGGDSITARFLYNEPFTYTPQFKLWLAVNSLPKVDDFSKGFWRRVRIIPFERLFEGDNKDLKMEDKLKMELPGILNWFLKGFQEWKQQGLNPPVEVINATKEYQSESDVVTLFLEDEILIDEKSRIKTKELYVAFCGWHDGEFSGKPITQNMFSRRVGNCIGGKLEKIGSYRWFVGIRLKESLHGP